jgi:hypothetical protein
MTPESLILNPLLGRLRGSGGLSRTRNQGFEARVGAQRVCSRLLGQMHHIVGALVVSPAQPAERLLDITRKPL